MKKGDLVDITDRFFAGDAKHHSAETGAKADAWVPAGMAFKPAAPTEDTDSTEHVSEIDGQVEAENADANASLEALSGDGVVGAFPDDADRAEPQSGNTDAHPARGPADAGAVPEQGGDGSIAVIPDERLADSDTGPDEDPSTGEPDAVASEACAA